MEGAEGRGDSDLNGAADRVLDIAMAQQKSVRWNLAEKLSET